MEGFAPFNPSFNPPRDKHFWLALFIAMAVLLPRSALIMRQQNEGMDADFHLRHGLALLLGTRDRIIMGSNDPPLGQMILALPMAVVGCNPGQPIVAENWPRGVSTPGELQSSPQRAEYERLIRRGVLYGNRLPPGTLLVLLAIWKAMLFVPAMLVIFQWCRGVYGLRAAWITQGLLLVDPTLAAHIAQPALDTLGVETIVFACFAIALYFERETTWRLTLVAVSTAAALLTKHTAVITPIVFLLLAGYHWIWRPWRDHAAFPSWREKFNVLAMAGLIGCLAIWVLLLFDISRPSDQTVGSPRARNPSWIAEKIDNALERRWPAGTYIGCFANGFHINQSGQRSLLFGQITRHGRWDYFPLVATMKVPIGCAVLFAAALVATLIHRRLRVGEITILIPLLAWTIFLMQARMNTGFRHFLPAYVFWCMWAGGAIAQLGRWGTALAAACLLAASIHVATFHPDYLSYVNFPRKAVWMDMTDSNLDWNQSIRQIGPWLDRHPEFSNRTISVAPRLGQAEYVGPYWLDERVKFIDRGKPPPTSGILIISPVWVCGVYDDPTEAPNPYEFLQSRTPIGWVGHSQLVYDLDAE